MSFTLYYTVGGGTPNYVVDLSGSTKSPNTHTSDGTYTFTDVPEGSYIINSIDSNGCVLSEPITLTPTPTTTEAPSCKLVSFLRSTTPENGEQSDGTITITNVTTISGNITYSIDGVLWQSSNIFHSLPSGVYTVYVNDDIVPDCVITGLTEITKEIEINEYTISFSNITVNSGDGGGDGSIESPYDSGVILDFNVIGNGGVGFQTPTNYSIGITTAFPDNNLIGVSYGCLNYSDGDLLLLSPPFGGLLNNTDIDSFDGGWGCVVDRNSVEFHNATTNRIPSSIQLDLYLNSVLVDSFTRFISGFGVVPPTELV